MEMTELEKVIRGLRDIDMFIAGRLEHEKAKNFLRTIDETIALLKEQNAVYPKQGEWIYCEDASGQDGYKCSECGFFEPWYYDFENHNFITDYAYCPSCGKPMQEGR